MVIEVLSSSQGERRPYIKQNGVVTVLIPIRELPIVIKLKRSGQHRVFHGRWRHLQMTCQLLDLLPEIIVPEFCHRIHEYQMGGVNPIRKRCIFQNQQQWRLEKITKITSVSELNIGCNSSNCNRELWLYLLLQVVLNILFPSWNSSSHFSLLLSFSNASKKSILHEGWLIIRIPRKRKSALTAHSCTK